MNNTGYFSEMHQKLELKCKFMSIIKVNFNYMTKNLFIFLIVLLPFLSLSQQLSEKDREILRQDLSEMINNLRISKGLKSLIFNDTLRKAAEFHSEYMVKNDILTHNQRLSKYRTPKNRVTE